MIGKQEQRNIFEFKIKIDQSVSNQKILFEILECFEDINSIFDLKSIIIHKELFNRLIHTAETFGYFNIYDHDHPKLFGLKIIRSNDIEENYIFLF